MLSRGSLVFSLYRHQLSMLFLIVLSLLVLIQSSYGLQIQRTQQLGKIKRKLRSIANTLKQDLEDPLLCIQCGKSTIEDITPTFLSNLGKSFDCCIAPILYSLLLTSLHFTSLHFTLLFLCYSFPL